MKTFFVSNRLLAFRLGASVTIATLFFAILLPQHISIAAKRAELDRLEKKIALANESIEESERIQPVLRQKQQELRQDEADLSPSDMYFLMLKRLKRLTGASVEIAMEPSSSDEAGEAYYAPYSTMVFPVHGVGKYHDLGQFLAELENSSPYAKVQDLEIEPLTSDRGDGKLTFKFNLLTLICPPVSTPEVLASSKER